MSLLSGKWGKAMTKASDMKLIANNNKAPSDIAEEAKAPAFAGPHKPLPETPEEAPHIYPIDRIIQSSIGKASLGISPISLALAFFDWAAHLSLAPGKQNQLREEAFKNLFLRGLYFQRCCEAGKDEIPENIIQPKARDRRFDNQAWQSWPYNFYAQNFLMSEKWWDQATKNIHGVSRHHTDVMNFTMRQILDIFSPSNYPWTNPRILQKSIEDQGQNFVEGTQNLFEDLCTLVSEGNAKSPDAFKPGESVAITKGKVVYQNHLIELIHYEPQTDKVYPEPLMIIPAWIMKYYILDLSPYNSLVDYLVKQGHSVFMISWKNPGSAERDMGFEDYLNFGVMEAIKMVQAIVPNQKINATGYCLGGTLLMMAASWLERRQQDVFNSITLLAAQVDFEEAGELMLFMDESQLAFLEDTMWQQGYLDQHQMAGAFNLLRSNDLIWSRLVNDYLMGERHAANDLMAWNSDATRMPFKMHSQYLRSLYLNNELSEGHFKVNDQTITLTDIKRPVFSVGTQKDHVAPWQSVYKLHLYTDTDVTFVLTTGGHNAGIISEPGHKGRSYQMATQDKDSAYISPQNWMNAAPHKDGSWWPEWQKWLASHSGVKTNPPAMGMALYDAPGRYVMQK
jgi:polyhydroxyalkanoate synthase